MIAEGLSLMVLGVLQRFAEARYLLVPTDWLLRTEPWSCGAAR